MYTQNTIGTLSRIAIKPLMWRLLESPDGTYMLEATYVSPDRHDWFPITTARGEVKVYKIVTAAIADIRRVDLDTVVQLKLAA